MINYDDSLISRWTGKIIYIPNGGGKTTSSKKLLESLSAIQGNQVNLFTRRSLDDLIAIGDAKRNEVYFGFDAKRVARRDEIQAQIEKAAPLLSYAKTTLCERSATKARERSFYCAFYNVQNLKSFPKRMKKPPTTSLVDFSQGGVAQRLDTVLSLQLFEESKSIVESVSNADNLLIDWDPNTQIPSEHRDEILDLYTYCVLYNVKTCVLCGKSYRGAKALQKKMDEHFANLTFAESDTAGRRIMKVANEIYSSAKNDALLSRLFPVKAKNIAACFRDINLYFRICNLTLYYVGKQLLSEPVSGSKTIDDLLDEHDSLEEIIKNHASNKRHLRRYNNYLIKELNNLIHFSGDVKPQPLEDAFGIAFILDGKKIDPSKVLSESETKRLALVALRTEIYFGKTNVLILDDPVDSYDDYNKLICIDYISLISSMGKLKQMFVLSNDFETVFRLSEKSKKNVIFYLPDFNLTFGGSGSRNYIDIECTPKDIDIISKNEVYLFGRFVGERPTMQFDYERMAVALALSCRNINSELFAKLTRLVIDKSNSASVVKDINWAADVERLIVRNSEHYMPSFVDPTSHSFSVTFGEICQCFAGLSKKRNSYSFVNTSDTRLFYDVRENLVHSPCAFANAGYGPLLDYVSKKIIVVNHTKFLLEKALVDLIDTSYGHTDAAAVVNAKSLGKKIKKAKEIDAASGAIVKRKLDKIASIYDKYSTLFNLFDHGLIQQLSPYLPASNIDIGDFYDEVISL